MIQRAAREMEEYSVNRAKSEPKNGSMQATVIAEMRRRIIKGDIEPGAPLSELALADEFGVSRTPVREALKQLQTEGLVEIRPRVGTFVTIPSRREITELFEMKELLEGAAARLLAQRGRVPEIDSLERNLREADEAVERDDRERYAELVHEFHDLLVAGADNTKLQAHYRMLMNQLAYSRLVNTSLSQPGRATQSDREHHVVLELILAKDGDSAEHVMREHVRASRRALLAGLPIGERHERFGAANS
ncbi:GntR family transcriptional regulator [Streptomyces nodosus]